MAAKYRTRKSARILICLVLGLAIPVLMSWFSPPESNSKLVLKEGGRRGIASVDEAAKEESKGAGKLGRPVTLDWDLSAHEFAKEVDGTHLRLKGFQKGMKTESIVNLSNGFTASIFASGAEFTTDFIELKEGANEIKVNVTDAHGRKMTKKIEITRRMPASLPEN